MAPTPSSDNPGLEPRSNSAPQRGAAAQDGNDVLTAELLIPVVFRHYQDTPDYVRASRLVDGEDGRSVFDDYGVTIHLQTGGAVRLDYDRRGYLAAYLPTYLISTKDVFLWDDEVFINGKIYDLSIYPIAEVERYEAESGHDIDEADDKQQELFALVKLFDTVFSDYMVYCQSACDGIGRIEAEAARGPPRNREEVQDLVGPIVHRIRENLCLVWVVLTASFPEEGYIRPRDDLEFAAERLDIVRDEDKKLREAFNLARKASKEYQAILENQFAPAA